MAVWIGKRAFGDGARQLGGGAAGLSVVAANGGPAVQLGETVEAALVEVRE